MKKCIRLLIGILFILMSMLSLAVIPVYASDFSNVQAEIDNNKQVTVKGVIGTDAGSQVAIRIVDSNGRIEYVDSTVSKELGNFQFSYFMPNIVPGNYEVILNALGSSGQVTASFSYGANLNLQGLSLSSGDFDKSFSSRITQYEVNVGQKVNSITVTPTASDSGATVKVNDKIVVSGQPSDPIELLEGTNTVRVTVASLTGQTKTYTITVNREINVKAGIEAKASIDLAKKVTVSGTISFDSELISLKIIDPKGNLEYIGNTISTSGGQFQLSYYLTNNTPGRYYVVLGGLGLSTQAMTYFDYAGGVELEDLVINHLSLYPDFDPNQMFYTAIADKSVNSITVTPTAGAGTGSLKINETNIESGDTSEPINIEEGTNIIKVTVLSEDGLISKTYNITIIKAGTLSQNGYVNAGIDINKRVRVSGAIGSKTGQLINVMIKDPNGQLEYLNTTKSKAEGNYAYEYTMTNTVKGKYTVIVGTADMVPLITNFIYYDPDLKDLAIDSGTLTPEFSANQTDYNVEVEYDTNSVRVTPTTADQDTIAKVNGTAVASGTESGEISLSVGYNLISVVAASPDGKITKTYRIHVQRKALLIIEPDSYDDYPVDDFPEDEKMEGEHPVDDPVDEPGDEG